MVICLERGADLHMAQRIPLPLTVYCISKIQIGFTFLVPAHPGSPGQRAVKRVCVCVCAWIWRWHIGIAILDRFPNPRIRDWGFHNPRIPPGLQDLTENIGFTAIKPIMRTTWVILGFFLMLGLRNTQSLDFRTENAARILGLQFLEAHCSHQ